MEIKSITLWIISYLTGELRHRGVKRIAISAMVHRKDLNKEDIPKLNASLKTMCHANGYDS